MYACYFWGINDTMHMRVGQAYSSNDDRTGNKRKTRYLKTRRKDEGN